ncbi:MAG: sn-glycerol-1-phosphate dehydrogenase [Myxococcota bacterium]
MSKIEICIDREMTRFQDRLETKKCVFAQDLLTRSAHEFASHLPSGRWLVVTDQTTRGIAGEVVLEHCRVAGIDVQEWVIEPGMGEHVPVADEQKVSLLMHRLRAGEPVQAVVAVGAGTVNDVAKMATFRCGIPYGVLATAPSMNGYTSGIAALLSEGVKTTQPCHSPVVCLADLDVMAAAPQRMIASGLGDLISKPVSHADWRLSHRLNGSYYSEDAMILVDAGGALLEGVAPRLAERDVEAVGRLTASLCLSGLAMSVAGSSSPASGAEHLISHYIDMTHFAFGEGHDFHGCQVGVGTITTAALYECLAQFDITGLDVEQRVRDWQPLEAHKFLLQKRFGTLFSAVLPHAEKAYPTPDELERRLSLLQAEWSSILTDLQRSLRAARDIREELISAGCPVRFRELGVSDERAWRAVSYCKDIRARYTVLHLAAELGVLEIWARKVLQELHQVVC